MKSVALLDNDTENIINEFYKQKRRHRTELGVCPYKHKCKEYVYSNEFNKYICKKGVCGL